MQLRNCQREEIHRTGYGGRGLAQSFQTSQGCHTQHINVFTNPEALPTLSILGFLMEISYCRHCCLNHWPLVDWIQSPIPLPTLESQWVGMKVLTLGQPAPILKPSRIPTWIISLPYKRQCQNKIKCRPGVKITSSHRQNQLDHRSKISSSLFHECKQNLTYIISYKCRW